MVIGQYYDVSIKVTNITSNPLETALSELCLTSPSGGITTPTEIIGNVLIWKNMLYRDTNGIQSWEVRICGISCTFSEFMVTPANTNDGVYEPYDGEKLDVVFPALGKNLLQVTATSKTESGCTFTVNNNGTITVSGTPTQYVALDIGIASVTSNNKVTISGLTDVTNVAWDSFVLYDADDNVIGTISGETASSNRTIDLSEYQAVTKMKVVVKRKNTNTAISGTIKPMV